MKDLTAQSSSTTECQKKERRIYRMCLKLVQSFHTNFFAQPVHDQRLVSVANDHQIAARTVAGRNDPSAPNIKCLLLLFIDGILTEE